MAKKKNTQPRGKQVLKKSLVSKRTDIDKLIEANKGKSFSETRSTTSSPSKGPALVQLPAPLNAVPKPIAALPARAPTSKPCPTRIYPAAGANQLQNRLQPTAGTHQLPKRVPRAPGAHQRQNRVHPAPGTHQAHQLQIRVHPNAGAPQPQNRAHPASGALQLQVPAYGQYLIRDRRNEKTPEAPLVRLPYEPPTPRALRHYKREGYFPFLDLPGELRNKIYEYSIPKQHYAIKWVDNNHKSKSLTYTHGRPTHTPAPKLDPGAAQRRRNLDYHHRRINPTYLSEDDIHPGPAVLLFVCKKLSEEAASVLYSGSMFHFHGLGVLRHFLDNLRPISTKSITRLALNYQYYGHPVKTVNQPWKEKHDALWSELCWRVADDCSLTHLSLNLTLPKSPTRFCAFDDAGNAGIGTRWIMPLWAFQDADIQRCWARIYCLTKDSAELQEQSLKIRKQILGDLWDEEAEMTRDDYGFELPGSKETKKGKIVKVHPDGRVEIEKEVF